MREQSLVYEGPVEVKELLKVMKRWFERNSYDVQEKQYSTKAKGEGRSIMVKWECDKKPDDYHRYIMTVKTKIDGKEAVVDGEKMLEGTMSADFEGQIEYDMENKWQRPSQRFLRAIYDKFFMEEKEAKIIKRLKDDVISFANEVKRYLNIE